MYTKAQIAAACKQFGPKLGPLPKLVNGAQLLWAMSGNESSFGANCTPRHEPAFDVGGIFFKSSKVQAELVAQYGSAAACSYGPWQIMFCNVEGKTPDQLADLATVAQVSVDFLNSRLKMFHPQTLEEIGSIWNAGHIQRPLSAGVQRYADELESNYRIAMA